MKKLTKKQFVELAKKGPIQIDENIFYVVVKMNEEQVNMNETFKKQLIEEGKYDNSYVGFMTNETEAPYHMNNLPIFGDQNKYVTKFFVKTQDDAINHDLRQRSLGILNRHFEFMNK